VVWNFTSLSQFQMSKSTKQISRLQNFAIFWFSLSNWTCTYLSMEDSWGHTSLQEFQEAAQELGKWIHVIHGLEMLNSSSMV
jgi:hypothetical protein